MKKILLACFAGITLSANAAVENLTFANSSIGTAQCSRAYTVRGTIKSVYFDVPATKTGAVTLATSEGTVFSVAAVSADTKYNPRLATHNGSGVAATWLTTGDGSTNAAANVVYGDIAVAGTLTATFIPAVGTTETNTWTVKVIYEK
jgi:hypothetical protein